MNSEFLPVMKCTIDNTLDQWLQGIEKKALVLQPWLAFSVLIFLLIRVDFFVSKVLKTDN